MGRRGLALHRESVGRAPAPRLGDAQGASKCGAGHCGSERHRTVKTPQPFTPRAVPESGPKTPQTTSWVDERPVSSGGCVDVCLPYMLLVPRGEEEGCPPPNVSGGARALQSGRQWTGAGIMNRG
eukprot:gene16845-biopygen12762